MNATCTHCRTSFVIPEEEIAFLEKMRCTFGETVVHLPAPTSCPICRMQVRTCHRNEKHLYRTVSAKSGKSVISIYAPEAPYKIYSQEEWNDDAFEAAEYGRPVDPDHSFFEQFESLRRDVPRMAVVTIANENAEFTTGTGYCKDCYLINSSEYCENCAYGKLYQKCRDVFDSAYMFDCELCYGCYSLHGCTRCTEVYFSHNSHDCLFSSHLIGCKNCILCTDLVQKEYHIRNVSCTKEEYERTLLALRGSFVAFEEAKRELRERMKQKPWKYANIVDGEGCTGDYLEHCRNCVECFDVNGSEDCRSVQVGVEAKDCQHCSNMYLKPELCYETLGTIEAYHCAYCLYVFHSQNLLYCEGCYFCRDCFGCSGLKHKQYCILNQQYTKEEYEVLVPRLIKAMQERGEFGVFFPPSLSTFGYNESLAHEYLPLSKEEARAQRFLWRDHTEEPLQVGKVIPAAMLPDSIADVPDEILQWAVACGETQRPFRITKQELSFLRAQQIPLPRLHPDVRYDIRMRMHTPRQLWDRSCSQCKKPIVTSFAPDRPEQILCESCYRTMISG